MSKQECGSCVNETAQPVEVRFVCNLKPDAKNVFVAGDFNGWDPSADRMRKRSGTFFKRIPLTPGQHQYKFVVDGEWLTDPAAPMQVPNARGSLNSVVNV